MDRVPRRRKVLGDFLEEDEELSVAEAPQVPFPILDLPDEILREILSWMNVRRCSRISQSCSHMRDRAWNCQYAITGEPHFVGPILNRAQHVKRLTLEPLGPFSRFDMVPHTLLRNLSHLNLLFAPQHETDIKSIAELISNQNSLKSLYVHHSVVSFVRKWPQLETVHLLSYTTGSPSDISALSRVTSLRSLTVNANDIASRGVAIDELLQLEKIDMAVVESVRATRRAHPYSGEALFQAVYASLEAAPGRHIKKIILQWPSQLIEFGSIRSLGYIGPNFSARVNNLVLSASFLLRTHAYLNAICDSHAHTFDWAIKHDGFLSALATHIDKVSQTLALHNRFFAMDMALQRCVEGSAATPEVALNCAIKYLRTEMVDNVLNRHPGIAAKSTEPIIQAVGVYALLDVRNNFKIIDLLLAHGAPLADVTMSTIMQLIPENEELVNYLYSHRLAAVDEQGDTVLHKIALYTTGERLFKLIRCLQTAGVDINAINREGHTALGLAISMLQASYLFSAPNSIKYILALLKCGANPTIFSGTAQLPLHVLLQTDVAESVYPLFAKLFHRLVRFQGADMTALELYLQNDTLEYLDSEADHSILESLSGWDFALQVKAIILADKYPHRPFSDILKCKITM